MKRVIDIVLSSIGIVLLTIPSIIIVVAIWVTSPGPAIFWSQRVGRNNQLFWMPKFRTMRIDTPLVATDLLTESTSHFTPIGSFLRRYSIDEIPQLVCVLAGSMSLVGPRPALESQTVLNEMRTAAGVHRLRPGITGLAQINGRDFLSDTEKLYFDQKYLAESSIGLDLQILVLTLVKALRREGVSH